VNPEWKKTSPAIQQDHAELPDDSGDRPVLNTVPRQHQWPDQSDEIEWAKTAADHRGHAGRRGVMDGLKSI
jgi:hypothetical protein